MCALGLHVPRSSAHHRNPWGHADGQFHKPAHNQGLGPSAGAFHRSQNAVIVDGVSDPLGQLPPPPNELDRIRELTVLPAPRESSKPLSTTQVLNSGPHIGGDDEAAAEEAWQVAQTAGGVAFETDPDPLEEQEYRLHAQPPSVTSAQIGSGPGLAGGDGGVYDAGLAEQANADAADAASYHFERTTGPYKVPNGLRRTSRPDVHYLASPRDAAPAADAAMGSTQQDFVHAKASGMRAKGGDRVPAAQAVDTYWPNERGVAAGHVPGGGNPMIGVEPKLDMSKMISREKKVPNLWGHGGKMEDVQKREMDSVEDVERYISFIRDKPPSPPARKNLAGEPVSQVLRDHPLPPPVPTVTPAGCFKPSTAQKQTGVMDDGFRGGSATAAATRAAMAAAEAARADAKLRDAQIYMATHSHQVWDPTTGSYAVRKGKPLGQAVGHKLEMQPTSKPGATGAAPSSLSYSGSRVILGDKDPAPGLIAETTMGQYGAYAPSRGIEEIRYSAVGHQAAGTGAPTRSC